MSVNKRFRRAQIKTKLNGNIEKHPFIKDSMRHNAFVIDHFIDRQTPVQIAIKVDCFRDDIYYMFYHNPMKVIKQFEDFLRVEFPAKFFDGTLVINFIIDEKIYSILQI